tara:strand:- start:519 stop:824 length:306 start_codon:yes stop_codon:yes gene_type:complete
MTTEQKRKISIEACQEMHYEIDLIRTRLEKLQRLFIEEAEQELRSTSSQKVIDRVHSSLRQRYSSIGNGTAISLSAAIEELDCCSRKAIVYSRDLLDALDQ